jgi:hypothetical protein
MQISYCEDVCKCTQKQAYSRKFGYIPFDLELILGLPCILPMLEVVHNLINFIQKWDVFISEFLDVMKLIKAKLY